MHAVCVVDAAGGEYALSAGLHSTAGSNGSAESPGPASARLVWGKTFWQPCRCPVAPCRCHRRTPEAGLAILPVFSLNVPVHWKLSTSAHDSWHRSFITLRSSSGRVACDFRVLGSCTRLFRARVTSTPGSADPAGSTEHLPTTSASSTCCLSSLAYTCKQSHNGASRIVPSGLQPTRYECPLNTEHIALEQARHAAIVISSVRLLVR